MTAVLASDSHHLLNIRLVSVATTFFIVKLNISVWCLQNPEYSSSIGAEASTFPKLGLSLKTNDKKTLNNSIYQSLFNNILSSSQQSFMRDFSK